MSIGMRVSKAKSSNGSFVYEVYDGPKFLGTFDSHRRAWRFIDKRMGEATSRSEDVSNWIASKD